MTLRREEAVIFSGWGPNTDWIRNIRAHPALQIQIGRESYAPEQRFLSEDESVAVVVEFRRQHPLASTPRRPDPRLGRSQLRHSREGLRSEPPIRVVSADAFSRDLNRSRLVVP